MRRTKCSGHARKQGSGQEKITRVEPGDLDKPGGAGGTGKGDLMHSHELNRGYRNFLDKATKISLKFVSFKAQSPP